MASNAPPPGFVKVTKAPAPPEGFSRIPQVMTAGKGDMQQPVMPWYAGLGDLAKSAGTGLGRGVTALAGGAGDAQEMMGNAAGGVAGWLGAGPEVKDLVSSAAQTAAFPGIGGHLPRTAEIQAPINELTGGGLDYKPQSTAGEYARTVGEFVPGAAIGPGGMGRKVAMAVVPAVMSETGGQLTKGTAAEPYARIAGALGGGFLAAGRGGGATKEMLRNADDQEAVKAQAGALYDKLDNAGVKYDADAYSDMLAGLSDKLKTYRATKAPMTADTINYLKEFHGKSPSFRDLEDMRQEATGILREVTATDTDKKAAGIVVSELSKFAEGSPLITNGSIPADEVAGMAKQARELARRNIIAKQISEMERKAGSYVSGDESGLRNQFASFMKSNRGKGLTPMEEEMFGKVVRREGLSNVLHSQGSRLIGNIGSTVAGGAGYVSGGGPIGAALGYALGQGVHLGMRKASEMLTKKSVRDALAAVLAGRSAQEVARSADATMRQQIAARLLLSTVGARAASQP